MSGRCVILGAGGHAQVVIDALLLIGVTEIHGVLDVNPSRWGSRILGVPVLGGDELLPDLTASGVTSFIVAVGTITSGAHRSRLYQLGLAAGLEPLTVIHPSAVCSSAAAIGAGSVVFATAVINAGSVLGVNTIINTGAIVDHDCVIGDHVHIAPGATLSGMVHVGQGALIGAGAALQQSVSIGEEAIVGAGAVVVGDVPSRAVVVGNPARPITQRRRAE